MRIKTLFLDIIALASRELENWVLVLQIFYGTFVLEDINLMSDIRRFVCSLLDAADRSLPN